MSKLNIVGVSIGNIEDLTIRAIKHIFESDIILAEDTRVFKKLKNILKEKYGDLLHVLLSLEGDVSRRQRVIENSNQQILSYREQNHEKTLPFVLNYLQQDKKVSLVSDSGMPAISDPGYQLVRDVLKSGYEIDVIPGPTAMTTALVQSGLPTDKFTFLGFLPRKKGKAISILKPYFELETTVIIYESPFRVLKTLEMIKEEFGKEVQIAACKELTKKFQEVVRGRVGEVAD